MLVLLVLLDTNASPTKAGGMILPVVQQNWIVVVVVVVLNMYFVQKQYANTMKMLDRQ